MSEQAQVAAAAEEAAPGSVAGAWKWEIRKRIWDMMEETNIAEFPRCACSAVARSGESCCLLAQGREGRARLLTAQPERS